MIFRHHDEAKTGAVNVLVQWIRKSGAAKAVLIDDVYGKYRAIIWPGAAAGPGTEVDLAAALAQDAGPYWSGQIWVVSAETAALDLRVYESAWNEGHSHPEELRLRILERVRNKGVWFAPLAEPPWKARGAVGEKGPPILVFYSFKGGVGRTTALASFAIQRARRGERVVVIDGDLDAPGLGPLFSTRPPGARTDPDPGPENSRDESAWVEMASPQWGVVDYLLEAPSSKDADLADYSQIFRDEAISAGAGEIVVFPAGRLDENYLSKLARLDFDPAREGTTSPWIDLLQRIRRELKPHWILLDSRAGLGEPAGLFLGGMAHLHMLLGTSSEQSWQGIQLVLERIGSGRVRDSQPQVECVLVQAMIPETHDPAADAKAAFLARAEREFEEHYYAEDPADGGGDSIWCVGDMASKDAPHRPVCLSYKQNLAHFRSLQNVLTDLTGSEYQELAQRIRDRFVEDVI